MAEKLAERGVPSIAHELGGGNPWPRILWGSDPEKLLHVASKLGFDSILLPGDPFVRRPSKLVDLRRALAGPRAKAYLRLSLVSFDMSHPLVETAAPDFSLRRISTAFPVDPRQPAAAQGCAFARQASPAIEAWWRDFMTKCAEAGIAGFVIPVENELTCMLAGKLRTACDLPLIAETRGTSNALLSAIAEAGFVFTTSSLPWWNERAHWLMMERERLLPVAPPLAPVALPESIPAPSAIRRARLIAAAVTGAGWIMPSGFEVGIEDDVRWLNRHLADSGDRQLMEIRALPHRRGILLLHHEGTGLVAAFNSSTYEVPSALDGVTGLAAAEFKPVFPTQSVLHPGEAALFELVPAAMPNRQPAVDTIDSASAPHLRIIIDRIDPTINGGEYPVKRLAGDLLTVTANIFMDGHTHLAARLCLKRDHEKEWHFYPMTHLGNDRWVGQASLPGIGGYQFAVEAWLDDWRSFRSDLEKKIVAGNVTDADLQDGRAIIAAHAGQHRGQKKRPFDRVLRDINGVTPDSLAELLRSPSIEETMAASDHRPFLVRSFRQPLRVERRAAHYASWYELFPRSVTEDPGRHGTFRDVIRRLPAIRAMGFDTLYFPPIHPIGLTNRKGANNNLTAGKGEPGSPYAIGGDAGGHDALHPELGSFDDFRDLVDAARRNGIELALDFAIQCSPDHPWLREHSEWFNWRTDGTVKYAENPPKKYQDIVNVDFYKEGALPGLWLALRDIVLFWVWHGVKCFRVDNPHTKPMPFWRWLIAEVAARHPDVIFLSEAFTRPAPMYHLAKVGFSQSYTYFTWRNTKRELTDYFTELATTEVKEYFRPHLFVNTPDINPIFLQQSGRAGFLIRACLGATLSGLFGIYSGFELCEAAPLPGREEYLDSEKYQIRIRDWQQPGNIVTEITELNRLRRYEPALQTHLNTVFYNAFNDEILYYGKHVPDHADMVLVAVNLDPFNAQSANIEVPLWQFGLDDAAAVDVEDLLRGQHFVWHGKIQNITLHPDMPYSIWRIRPRREI